MGYDNNNESSDHSKGHGEDKGKKKGDDLDKEEGNTHGNNESQNKEPVESSSTAAGTTPFGVFERLVHDLMEGRQGDRVLARAPNKLQKLGYKQDLRSMRLAWPHMSEALRREAIDCYSGIDEDHPQGAGVRADSPSYNIVNAAEEAAETASVASSESSGHFSNASQNPNYVPRHLRKWHALDLLRKERVAKERAEKEQADKERAEKDRADKERAAEEQADKGKGKVVEKEEDKPSLSSYFAHYRDYSDEDEDEEGGVPI